MGNNGKVSCTIDNRFCSFFFFFVLGLATKTAFFYRRKEKCRAKKPYSFFFHRIKRKNNKRINWVFFFLVFTILAFLGGKLQNNFTHNRWCFCCMKTIMLVLNATLFWTTLISKKRLWNVFGKRKAVFFPSYHPKIASNRNTGHFLF